MNCRGFDGRGAGAIGLGLVFVFTGIGHFVQTTPMVQMLPPWVPARLPLVYATGVLEFATAFALFVPRFRRAAGWAAAAMLVLFFPANVYAAFNHVPMGGHAWGPVYLLVRVPLQLTVLVWAYVFTIRKPAAVRDAGKQ
ncbi:DoxX family protein [Luteimonas sp. A277]